MSSLMSHGSLSRMTDKYGFATTFNYFRKKKVLVDVTFIIETEDDEEEIFAHQQLLAMRSVYFADLFYENGRGRKIKEYQIIPLGKINVKAFECMIRYCYDIQPGLETIDETCTMFKVAHQFKVIGLMNECRTCIGDIKVTTANIFNMLEISEFVEDNKLRDTCCKFLKDKTRDILSSCKMREITSAMVHIIVSLPTLSFYSEYELIKWVFEWAKVQSEEGSVRKSVREYLGSIFKSLNFLALTFMEFALLCKDYPDVFTSEEIASIYLNIAIPSARDMPGWYDKEMKIRKYTGSMT